MQNVGNGIWECRPAVHTKSRSAVVTLSDELDAWLQNADPMRLVEPNFSVDGANQNAAADTMEFRTHH